MLKFTALADRVVLGPGAVGEKVIEAVSEKVGKKVGEKLSENEKALLLLLVEDPAYTYSELAARSGTSEKTVHKWMKSLKEREIIERIGSARAGYWEIKY